MDYQGLVNYIEKQEEWASETDCFDIAIFRIWVQFEKFLSKKFIDYSIGKYSYNGEDIRRLSFSDELHFKKFMMGEKQYIEYLTKIENVSDSIFMEGRNPFDIINNDIEYSNTYRLLRALRNHIAHESEESRKRYIKMLCGGNVDNFKEPNTYLKEWKKGSNTVTNYTHFLESIKKMAYLIEVPVFS